MRCTAERSQEANRSKAAERSSAEGVMNADGSGPSMAESKAVADPGEIPMKKIWLYWKNLSHTPGFECKIM